MSVMPGLNPGSAADYRHGMVSRSGPGAGSWSEGPTATLAQNFDTQPPSQIPVSWQRIARSKSMLAWCHSYDVGSQRSML